MATMAAATMDPGAIAAGFERDGFVVVPEVLAPGEAARVLGALWEASAETQRRGTPTFIEGLDPNAANVRVFDIVDCDPVFGDLLEHPVAHALASTLLGERYIVSNFSANIARPGSGSMMFHSDLSLVAPEPWTAPWSLNVIWCLTDVHHANGGTLYLPGSHRIVHRDEVPADYADRLVAFEAPAGSIVAMEGRVWHTSGRNVTADEDRALMFAYYTAPFLRPQWNWSVALRPEVQERFSPTMRYRLGLDKALNV